MRRRRPWRRSAMRQIIFAGLLGLLVFGHVPDAWALLGILVICASGLVVAWRRGR